MTSYAHFEHGYALLMGVGADLPNTIEDARGLRDILIDPHRCAYPTEQVRCLLGEDATRQEILDGLRWLAEKSATDAQSTIMLYYSGHGGYTADERYFLVPFGWQASRLEQTAVSGVEMTQGIYAIVAYFAGGAKSPMPFEGSFSTPLSLSGHYPDLVRKYQ